MQPDWSNVFNTPLTGPEQLAYEAWRANLPAELQNVHDYDLQGAWKGGALKSENDHLPDTWKKPNHMTFSTGSIYSTPQTHGGTWKEQADGTWLFEATPANLKGKDPSDLLNYFQAYEQGNKVKLPKGTK